MGVQRWAWDRRLLRASLVTAVAAGIITVAVTRHDAGASRRALPSVELRGEVQTPPPTVAPSLAARGWPITTKGKAHDIEGWADHTSISPGEPVRLYVSTVSRTFTVKAFRMGWYDGVQATEVWRSDAITGEEQAEAIVTRSTHTASAAHWSPSVTVATSKWAPGAYLFRLDAADGAQRYVPLTVRGPSAAGKVLIVNAVTTWQAYNTWGGASLYHGTGGASDADGRARAVSFDRPYAGDGAGDFIGNELPLIALAEKLQLPLDYATDVDIHADPSLLTNARAVITLGHDEYWSAAMRAAVTDAHDLGTNVAFLGANAMFRHIRLSATSVGPDRLEIAYKQASEDPLRHTDPADVTTNWREPPVGRPESDLTGVLYECNPVKADMVITNAGNWLFAGAEATNGLRLPGLVGAEYDRVNPARPCLGRSRYSPTRRFVAAAFRASLTPRTTRHPRARGCSHRAPARGWQHSPRASRPSAP